MKVGTITGLTLNPTTYMADAHVALDKSVLLPTDSAILISSEGLLGGNFVELVPGGSPDNLAPGDEIEDTQGAVSLITLLMKFVGTKVDPPKAEAGATPWDCWRFLCFCWRNPLPPKRLSLIHI